MATKPAKEAKFVELKRLFKHLSSIEPLTYQECHQFYKQKKTDMMKNLYEQIAIAAKK